MNRAAPRHAEFDSLRGMVAAIVLLYHFEDSAWQVKPHWLQSLLMSPLSIVVAGMRRSSCSLSSALLLIYGGRMRAPAPATEYFADWIVSLGVLELMILSVNSGRLRNFLTIPFLGRLGNISYSLLHGLGGTVPIPVLFALYLALAFAVAVVFDARGRAGPTS